MATPFRLLEKASCLENLPLTEAKDHVLDLHDIKDIAF